MLFVFDVRIKSDQTFKLKSSDKVICDNNPIIDIKTVVYADGSFDEDKFPSGISSFVQEINEKAKIKDSIQKKH